MIDKYWLVKNWTFNPAQEDLIPEAEPKKWKNLRYFTLPFEFHFENIDNAMIFTDITKQQEHTIKMIELYSKHEYYNKIISEKTRSQYNNFYFFKWYYYKIDELKLWLVKKDWRNNTFIQTERPTIQKPEQNKNKNKKKKKVLTISRDAIRKITWYSPYVVPKWGTKQVYIKWQDTLLQDDSPIILLDWSRQLGKSVLYNQKVFCQDYWYKEAQHVKVWDKILWSNYKFTEITQLSYSKKPSYKITLENWMEHTISEEHRIPLSHNFNWEKWDANKLNNKEHYINAKSLFEKFINLNKELDILKENRRLNKNRTLPERKIQERLQREANLFIPTAFNYSFWYNDNKKETHTREDFMLLWYFIWDWCRKTNQISWNHNRLKDIISEYKITSNLKWTSNIYNIEKYKQRTNFNWVDLYSYEKFIDNKVFLTSNINQWAFLEWIFNTDAYLSISNNRAASIEYCSTSKQLIIQLQLLLLKLGVICAIRTKKIRSNFKKHREFAYYLYITNKESLILLDSKIDITTKLNYTKFKARLTDNNIQTNWKVSLIPLDAVNNITNTSRTNKKPSYPFQRRKIKSKHFIWDNLESWLDYLWVKIKNIEYIWEEKVVTIAVKSDDELYFSNWILTHNSLTIAEKAVELSFLPNEDTLVGWYIKKTTDVIRNYMLKFINKFDDGIFTHFKSEWYILNTKSWTKIYFRTLDWDAENVLWLTLSNIIIDEAQLISDYVFEEVLEPTLATTNWRMILIWTPWKTAKWYYYDLIMEAKKGIELAWIKIAVKSESLPDVSYYQIDITQNPLVNPKLRERVMKNQAKAKNQRQWFCSWNSWDDILFKPLQTSSYPIIWEEWYFIITFDPARPWADRSAFTVLYIINWKIYVILSGFVPKSHKKQWSTQISYYQKTIIKQFWSFPKIVYWVDIRWVWEWFNEAFKHTFKDKTLIKIWYTSWDTESSKGIDWRVSKTRLIWNAVDFMEEWIVEVLKTSNKDLLEEMNFIYEDEDNKGRLAMKSMFKDDITNSFLVGLHIAKIRNLVKRSNHTTEDQKDNLEDWNKVFEPKKKKRLRKVW